MGENDEVEGREVGRGVKTQKINEKSSGRSQTGKEERGDNGEGIDLGYI